MGKTITEKILAKAAGKDAVSPGEYLTVKVGALASMDFMFFVQWLDANDIKVWDKDRFLISVDHLQMINDLGPLRKFAKKQGIQMFDIGRQGVGHQVPAEEGYVVPGIVYVNADTQAPTCGALGCVALPGVNDIHIIAALGDTWVRVPESVKVVLTGKLPKGVGGKDVFMRALQIIGHENMVSRMIEFVGPGVESMGLDQRMALCNGTSVVGALSGIINPDKVTLDFVTPRAKWPFEVFTSDADAQYVLTAEVNLSDIEPMVAFPPDAANVHNLSEIIGTEIQQAHIGSCASARMEDLAVAAEIVRGKKVAPWVRFIISPASSRIAAEAARNGIMADLIEAGATVTIPGCGACYSGCQSPGILTDDEVCLTTSTENMPGRMGSKEATIYIATAAAVAAAALEGKVVDPRKYLGRN